MTLFPFKAGGMRAQVSGRMVFQGRQKEHQEGGPLNWSRDREEVMENRAKYCKCLNWELQTLTQLVCFTVIPRPFKWYLFSTWRPTQVISSNWVVVQLLMEKSSKSCCRKLSRGLLSWAEWDRDGPVACGHLVHLLCDVKAIYVGIGFSKCKLKHSIRVLWGYTGYIMNTQYRWTSRSQCRFFSAYTEPPFMDMLYEQGCAMA